MESLKNIALALSGGGYRAATYHFGVLSCLHKAGLLSKVTMISSVSGGSITAIKYAASLVEKKSFSDFEIELEDFLKHTNLIDRALKLVSTKTTNRRLPSHTLITAFAELYHQHLLSKKTKYFGSLWSKAFNKSHLKELSINSTEFHSGNSFRFTRSQNGRTVIGNKNLRLVQEDVRKMRLGDILAASSCFPGGFEPIDVLQDFAFDKSFDHQSYEKKWRTREAPLMDGGIYDNQGMEGIKLAVDRNNGFDTVIISDTDQEDNYPLYAEPKSFNSLQFTVSKGLTYFSTLLFLVIGCIAFTLISLLNVFTSLTASIVTVLFSCSLLGIWFWKKSERFLSSIKQRIPNQFNPAMKKIDDMEIKTLVNALLVRGVSLVKMATAIFMKRVREQVYDSSFMKKELKGKIVSNLIYEIDSESSVDGIKASVSKLRKVELAKNMPTTLWFTDSDHTQFHSLKDTGEFTTAYNLIKYIDRHLPQLSDIEQKELRKTRVILKNIWKSHL